MVTVSGLTASAKLAGPDSTAHSRAAPVTALPTGAVSTECATAHRVSWARLANRRCVPMDAVVTVAAMVSLGSASVTLDMEVLTALSRSALTVRTDSAVTMPHVCARLDSRDLLAMTRPVRRIVHPTAASATAVTVCARSACLEYRARPRPPPRGAPETATTMEFARSGQVSVTVTTASLEPTVPLPDASVDVTSPTAGASTEHASVHPTSTGQTASKRNARTRALVAESATLRHMRATATPAGLAMTAVSRPALS